MSGHMIEFRAHVRSASGHLAKPGSGTGPAFFDDARPEACSERDAKLPGKRRPLFSRQHLR